MLPKLRATVSDSEELRDVSPALDATSSLAPVDDESCGKLPSRSFRMLPKPRATVSDSEERGDEPSARETTSSLAPVDDES